MTPVAGNAKSFELMQDRVTGFLFPLPDFFDELLASQLHPADALLCELTLDYVLSRDAGMIGARHPKNTLAIHTLVAAENVLQRIIEGVAHVQRAGDIGRRD